MTKKKKPASPSVRWDMGTATHLMYDFKGKRYFHAFKKRVKLGRAGRYLVIGPVSVKPGEVRG